jgi:hypothetical protein
LELAGNSGLQAAAEVFNGCEGDVRINDISFGGASSGFLECCVKGASDGNSGLSRSGTEGGQCSQGKIFNILSQSSRKVFVNIPQ